MRIPLLSKLMWLALGSTAVALLFSKRRAPQSADMAPDPADSVQDPDLVDPLDPLADLDVDAMSMIDRDVDVEGASNDEDLIEATVEDTGDFYGVHTPRAQDRVHPDDDTAMDDGQNWIEALSTSASENGPRPEESLDSIVDDEDIYAAPHAGDSNDTPVADRGSGGPGGM